MGIYVQKYQIDIPGPLNDWFQVCIWQAGYTGGLIILDPGSANPIEIIQKGEGDNEFDVIRGRIAKVTIWCDTEGKFTEFYTAANPRDYKIQIYRYVGEELYTIFSGFLLQEEHTEPYVPVPYPVTISFTDQLGEIKNIDFTLDDWSITDEFTVIQQCLVLAGLDGDFNSALDIFGPEKSQDLTTFETLKMAFIDPVIYKEKSCAEVIEDILGGYGAIIRQRKGEYEIIRVTSQDAPYVLRHFSTYGTLLSHETIDPIRVISDEEEDFLMFVDGGEEMSYISPVGKFTITQDYGLKNNILPGGDFTDPDEWYKVGGLWQLRHWTQNNEMDQIEREFYENQYILKLYHDHTTLRYLQNTSLILQEATIADVPVTTIVVEIEYFVYGFKYILGERVPTTCSLIFRIKSGNYYFRTSVIEGENEVEWTIQHGFIQILNVEAKPDMVKNQVKISLQTENIPATGALEVDIYQPMTTEGGTVYLYIKNFSISLNYAGAIPEKQLELTTVLNPTNSRKLDDKTLMLGDLPACKNADRIWANCIWVSNVPSSEWNIAGEDNTYSLINLLARMITTLYQQPRQRIRGELFGDMDSSSVIEDPGNGHKKFIPAGSSYYPAKGTHRGEWVEIVTTTLVGIGVMIIGSTFIVG